MRKLSLIDNYGTVCGVGYMSDDGNPREEQSLKELRNQIARSGIAAKLVIENVDDMNMTELGNAMEEYQIAIDELDNCED